jgi:chorismate mutase
MTSSTLDDLRRDIDRVDEVLVRLLNERARCVCEVGRLKKEGGLDVYQPDREKEVLAHVRSVAAEGPLGAEAVGRLFERIIDEARRLERRVVHDGIDPLEGAHATRGAVKAVEAGDATPTRDQGE